MRRTHGDYMQMALAEAAVALQQGEVPIGAIVVKDDQVLARAYNCRETLGDPTAHAEVLALRQAARALGSWRLQGCALYVTLEPCVMCAGAIVQARVATLVYGAPDPKAGAVDSLMNLVEFPGWNHRVMVVPGVREEECRALLQRFFAERRSKLFQKRRDG